eukprot:TRINITY_DN1694_c0_g1_i4.p2 TRINITY_DN1694_c0_g1~~TRINITY_DN1694_c0_g1_i4.p2  ORF type:complete len:369 (-),score=149.97 TRINITY_DN1694_c0_g1_i4:632-1738(-)
MLSDGNATTTTMMLLMMDDAANHHDVDADACYADTTTDDNSRDLMMFVWSCVMWQLRVVGCLVGWLVGCWEQIVKMIGLSLGLLIWGTVNLLAGWASGTFGLFGMNKETVAHPALNYIGVGFAVLSVLIMVGIKTDVSTKVDQPSSSSSSSSGAKHHHQQQQAPSYYAPGGYGAEELGYERINDHLHPPTAAPDATDSDTDSWVDKLSMGQRRILGFMMASVAGVLYGVNFDPPTYVMNHNPDKSQNGLDYVFSHFCGIYGTSTLFVLIYCAAKRNRPAVFPQAILPGFICGAMWAIAQISWFFANNALSLVISFPIISTGPGIVASLWGIFAFGEIRGVRNYIVLLCAFACVITSAVLTSLSSMPTI